MLLAALSSPLKTRAALQSENIALRHQIGVLQRSAKKRTPLRAFDRLLCVDHCTLLHAGVESARFGAYITRTAVLLGRILLLRVRNDSRKVSAGVAL